MAAYRRVYDSRHLQADCQVPGSPPEPYVWATFTFFSCTKSAQWSFSDANEALQLMAEFTAMA